MFIIFKFKVLAKILMGQEIVRSTEFAHTMSWQTEFIIIRTILFSDSAFDQEKIQGNTNLLNI